MKPEKTIDKMSEKTTKPVGKKKTQISWWTQIKMQWLIGKIIKKPTDTGLVFKYFDVVMGMEPEIVDAHFARMFQRNPIETDFSEQYFSKPALHQMMGGQYESDQFGFHAQRFFIDNGLEVDFYPEIFASSPTKKNYIIQRFYQAHDMWHVLLGAKTEPVDEMVVLAFTAGQILAPSSINIAFAAFISSLQDNPHWSIELFETMIAAYQLGRACPSLLEKKPEKDFDQPISQVREKLGIPKQGLVYLREPTH